MDYKETNIYKYWMSFRQNGGETFTSVKIFKLYKKIIADLQKSNGDFYFDKNRAKHPIEFIEKYCHPSKGKQANKPLQLMLWQKAMIESIFGFVDIEGNRKYRRVFLLIGRKNGKSAIASAIGLYMMIADNENGSQILATAAKKDQAKIIWQEAKLMVKKSPMLRKMIKARVADMIADFNDADFKPLASDSDSLDGLNAHCSLMDEIHSWKGRGGRPLYDVIVDSMTAREQPLILITTTSGTTREDIFDELREEMGDVINGWDNPEGYQDERTIPFMYELDDPEEWRDEEKWIKANPGIGVIKKFQSLKEKVDLAKQNQRMIRTAYTHQVANQPILIPETTMAGILSLIEEQHPFYGEIRKLNVRGNLTIKQHVSVDAGDAAFVDEGTPATDEKNTFAEITLTGFELAKLVRVSFKLEAMSIPEFISYIQVEIADRVGRTLGNAVFNGTGVKQPKGLLTVLSAQSGTPQVVTTTEVTYQDLTALRSKIASQFAPGIKFYAQSATIWNTLANIVDGNKRPIFIREVVDGGVGTIFGVPVVEDDGVPAGEVVLGNPAAGVVQNTNEPFSIQTERSVVDRETRYQGYTVLDWAVTYTQAFAHLKVTAAAGGTGE